MNVQMNVQHEHSNERSNERAARTEEVKVPATRTEACLSFLETRCVEQCSGNFENTRSVKKLT